MNYFEWWEKARQSSRILTKPTYTKQLEERIKALEAGKKGQKFKDLENQLKQEKKANHQLTTFLKNECGFTDLADGRTQLNGQTIPQILTYCQKLQEDNQDLLKTIHQNKQDKTKLVNQANQQITQLEKEKQEIKLSFVQEKSTGTTHWIYWKNWAEKEVAKWKNQNTKLIQDYNQLNQQLNNFLQSQGVASFSELRKAIENSKQLLATYHKSDALSFFETEPEEVLRVVKQHPHQLYYLFYSIGGKNQELDLAPLSLKFEDTCLFFGTFGEGNLAVNFNSQQKAVLDLRTKRPPQELLGATKGKWFVGDKVEVFKEGMEETPSQSSTGSSSSQTQPTKKKKWYKGGNK